MQYAGPQPPGRTPTIKTGSLQQTDNYIWNTADAIGRGATAIVYFGRHKDTGDVCAVKVFHRGWRSGSASQQREIGTLKSVQHVNIVKFLGLEKEITSGNEVLVMEYCSGGSVFAMLEQPQYASGFPLSEFMLFLVHLARGMQYLRTCGYIHRDIKPGNIMRAVGEDGRSVYKICDFGAARTLDDDETFMSIYGTEEYLFPGMYQRAVLRQPNSGNQEFDASVDIWSLGVTIYHVVTGQLPFRPYGGRSNTATMHAITSTKPSGAISGVQETAHGIIKWCHTLPATCRLPQSLQQFLVRMLAGLMENNPSLMWTFERFFQSVNELDNMITLKIFVVRDGKTKHLYVSKSARWTNITALIATESGHPVDDQLILWQDKDLQSMTDLTGLVYTYPKSILDATWILVSKQAVCDSALQVTKLPDFPAISMCENLDIDNQTGRQCAAVAYQIHSIIESTLEQQQWCGKAEIYFRLYVKKIVQEFDVILPVLDCAVTETRRRQMSFRSAFTVVMSLFDTITHLTNTGVLMFSKPETKCQLMDSISQLGSFLEDDTLEKFFQKIQVRQNEIKVYVEVLSRKIREQETDRFKVTLGCSADDHCLSKAENLRTKILGVSSTMNKHKKYKDLHSHEQFIHKCEKEKLQEHCVSMTSLANDHCIRNLYHCFKFATKEVGNLTKHLVRTKKVEQNIAAVRDSLEQLSTKLEAEENQCKVFVEKISVLLASTLRRGTGKHEAGTSRSDRDPPDATVLGLSGTVDISRTADGEEEQPRNHEGRTTHPHRSMQNEESSLVKAHRSKLLGQLTTELLSLKRDSDELKQLVAENSLVMQKFLNETSNLRIDGSLDSDTWSVPMEDATEGKGPAIPQIGITF